MSTAPTEQELTDALGLVVEMDGVESNVDDPQHAAYLELERRGQVKLSGARGPGRKWRRVELVSVDEAAKFNPFEHTCDDKAPTEPAPAEAPPPPAYVWGDASHTLKVLETLAEALSESYHAADALTPGVTYARLVSANRPGWYVSLVRWPRKDLKRVVASAQADDFPSAVRLCAQRWLASLQSEVEPSDAAKIKLTSLREVAGV